MSTVNVEKPSGWEEVPAFTIDGCDGLAVTMCEFGRFEVTHIKSGRRIIGGYERAVNAACCMAELSIGMKEAGIDGNLDMERLQHAMLTSEVKCNALNDMTVMQHINLLKPIMGFSGEFPWEGQDESPFTKLEELKALLQEPA